jgi:hypothetical protein
MGAYAGIASKINTVSTTVPMWNLRGATARRLKVFDLLIGCAATPADQASSFNLRRTSADGSPLTAFTPTKLDPADGASIASLDLTWTGAAEPTITGDSDLLQIPLNQRATVRWVAADGREIIVPAVSEAGLALLSAIATSPAIHNYCVLWTE